MATPSKPLLSVIIPAFNAAAWLEECVRSCLDQAYSELQVVVIDDGSTDDTARIAADLAARDERIELVQLDANHGPSAARNAGLDRARGGYTLYLDADDRLSAGSLSSIMARVIEERLDAAVGSWLHFESDQSMDRTPLPGPPRFASDALASLIQHPPVVSAIVLKRTPERWNAAMLTSELHDYFFRVLLQARRIAHVGVVVTEIRQRRDPDRVSNRFDHFEPMHRLHLYVDLKARIWRANQMTDAREDALDYHIAGAAYAARSRGHRALGHLVDVIEASRLPRHSWYRSTGLSGFMYRLGPRAGLESFYLANAALGRAPG